MHLFIYASYSKKDENIYGVKNVMVWNTAAWDVCSMLSFTKLFHHHLLPSLLPHNYYFFLICGKYTFSVTIQIKDKQDMPLHDFAKGQDL